MFYEGIRTLLGHFYFVGYVGQLMFFSAVEGIYRDR